jgi:TP901 family phage tail tape measure protein
MNIGTLTVTLGVNAEALDIAATRMAAFTKKMNAINQRLRTVGYLASAVITAPMVAAGRSAFNMAKEYEFSMQKIVGLTGTSQEVVDRWGEAIKGMAREFGKSPKEIADALYFIASSGIATADALEVLRVSVKASAAGLGETGDIANYVTSVLNAYRGTGITAAYATDVLVAAVREGKAEAAGFAAAMGGVIPIASKMGVEIDQVAGAMAAITLTGSTAAQAGVYLKNIFNALFKEADKGQKAMTSASLALSGMNTSYEDLRKILKDQGVVALVEKIRTLSAQYGETLVSQVFPEIRAMTGMMSLMGKNFAYNNSIMKEVTESSGALSAAFAAVSQTIKIRYDRALQSINVSLIELGKSIASAIIPLLERLSKWLDKVTDRFNALTEEQKRFRLIIAAVVAAAGPLLLLISTMGYGMTGLISGVGGVVKALAWLSRGMGLTAITAATAEAALAGTAAAGTAAAVGTTAAGTAAAAAGVSAGVAASSFIAFGAAMGVFGLGVWLVVENAIKPLIQKIAAMKKEYKETMALVNGTDVEMELDASISSKRWDLGKLSKAGLEGLKIDIAQRLALEQEDLDNANIVNAEKLKAEKGYQDKLAAIKQREKDWKWTDETSYGGEDWVNAFNKYQEDMQNLEKERDDYVKNGMEMAEYDKIASASIIKYYKEVAKEVDISLKKITDPIAKVEEELKQLQQRSEEVNSAFFDLAMGEASITRMLSLLGGSYDDLGEKTQLYKSILERLVEIEAKTGYTTPWVTAKINELTQALAELARVKVTRELQNIEGLGKIFGNSFTKSAESADVLKQALIDFNVNTRGTAGAFSVMGIQGKVLQTILDGLTTRWKNYTVAATVEDTSNTINYLKAQRDAFKTIDSEIEIVSAELEGYQRYMEVLYATNQQGSASWVIMAEKIKIAQLALQGLQGERDIAPLEGMADTFGRLEDYMSLASTQMDIAKERMILLIGQGKLFSDEYYAAADSYLRFKNVLESLQVENTLAPLQAMYETFGGLNNQIALVTGQLQAAQDAFDRLALSGIKSGEQFDKARGNLQLYREELLKLQMTSIIASQVGDMVAEMATNMGAAFAGAEGGFESMATALLSSLNQMVKAMLTAAIAAAILDGIVKKGLIAGLILASMAIGAITAIFQKGKSAAGGVAKLKEGGVIPEGYPNDTFPALLTSGEIVVPKNKVGDTKFLEEVLDVPKFAKGGIIPEGFPKGTYPALLTSGELVIDKEEYKQIEPINKLAEASKIKNEQMFKMPAVTESAKEIEAAHLQHGGTIPAGFPNDSYPAWLTSGETVIPKPQKLDFSGFAFGFKAMEESMAGAIKQGKTFGDKLHNFFADMATGVLTWSTQFRPPRAEELVAGRGSWEERAPMVSTAAIYGMADEMTGKVVSSIPGAIKAVKNIPGIGKDAPELGFHALNKEHWALHPNRLMKQASDVGVKPPSKLDMAMLYMYAAGNRLTPVIKKTPLVTAEKKVAERVMKYDPYRFRTTNDVFKALTDKKSLTYHGNFEKELDPTGRDLLNLYLYGNEKGFQKVANAVEGIDIGERYNDLYGNVNRYFMKSNVPHGTKVTSKNAAWSLEEPRMGIRSFQEGSENLVGPIDDIGGHLQKILETADGQLVAITQDFYKFNPVDYVKRLETDDSIGTITDFIKLQAEKQASIVDKLGKPFYLLQHNPIETGLVPGYGKKAGGKSSIINVIDNNEKLTKAEIDDFTQSIRDRMNAMSDLDWKKYIQKNTGKLPAIGGFGAVGAGLAFGGGEASAHEGDKAAKKYPDVFKIIDERTTDAITGKSVPSTSKLSTSFDTVFLEEIIRKSLEGGVDPYTSIAVHQQETLGMTKEDKMINPLMVGNVDQKYLENFYTDPLSVGIKVLSDKLKRAATLGRNSYAEALQLYNGTGPITRQSFGTTKAYGLDIPEEGISQKKNPIYGKRIEDIRNNILLQNEELVKYVESIAKGYPEPKYPMLSKIEEPHTLESIVPTDTTQALTDATLALDTYLQTFGIFNEKLDTLSTETNAATQGITNATFAAPTFDNPFGGYEPKPLSLGPTTIGEGEFGPTLADKERARKKKDAYTIANSATEGMSSIFSAAFQGGDVGKATVGAIGSVGSTTITTLLTTALSAIPIFGPILASLAGGIFGGIFSKLANGMAKGGVVPAGFPNDTYPAMLTSREVVLPQDKYKEYMKFIQSNKKPVKEYRDAPDMEFKPMEGEIGKLTEKGSTPSGSVSDELQLLLSTYEINFPEEKFKSLFAPLMKQPKVATEAINKRKVTSKIYNYNNVTEHLTKISKAQAIKNNALTKIKQGTNFTLTNNLAKVSKGLLTNDKSLSYLSRVTKMSKELRVKDRPFARTASEHISNNQTLDKISKMKKTNDKSLNYLTKISRETTLTESRFKKADFYPRVAKMATGGSVPSGYPNDTFPAFLSSGEHVLPKNVMSNLKGVSAKSQKLNITIDGKIAGKDLVLALRRANLTN